MTTPLQTAAQAVIARWESPKWKDEAPTAVVIGALLKALTDEQAQAVEPVATVRSMNGVTYGYLDVMQPVGTKLYLHPAPLITKPDSLPDRGNTTCNPHPDAPHGFSRNASHSAGRYVCDCEGWMPDAPE